MTDATTTDAPIAGTDEGRATVPALTAGLRGLAPTGSAGVPAQPRLPERSRAQRNRRRLTAGSFLLIVVVPTILASLYYGFFASDQYVSQVQLGVRAADAQRNDASAMFQGMSAASQIGLESNVVVKYMQSRELVEAVDRSLNLRAMFSRPEADAWSRLDPNANIEQLVDYWDKRVEPFFDFTTGVISVKVRAFTPPDALAISNEIVTRSEDLVNGLSKRAREDQVRLAQTQLDGAEARLKKARDDIFQFRNREKMIDPKKEADTRMSMLGRLQDDLSRTMTEVATIRAYLSDDAPTVRALRNRIAAIQAQIKSTEGNLTAGDSSASGGQDSPGTTLNRELGGFDKLEVERQIAERFYESSLTALERAQTEAARQSIYLAVFVRPALAQSAVFPRRSIATVLVALCALGAWMFLLLGYHSVREHI